MWVGFGGDVSVLVVILKVVDDVVFGLLVDFKEVLYFVNIG